MKESFESSTEYESSNQKEEVIIGDVGGKDKFSIENAREYTENLVNNFKKHYLALGYSEEPPVKISSGIDSTVRFVGSHISVFKPYLMNDNVPNPGLFMEQGCVRTRNVDKLLDDSYFPNWGSYFVSMGALVPPERLNAACEETFNFFENQLGIPNDDIVIRINSSDSDLMEACGIKYDKNLEIDSKNIDYYRHKIGVEDIRGRNFNIAIKSKNEKEFIDVGNVIILENSQRKLGVEIALGTSTILKQIYNLKHVQDCMPVIGLKDIKDDIVRRKFEDAIVTSTVLFREGLRPFGQNSRNRILKKYVKSLSYFRAKSGISIDDLKKIIFNFENREFSDSTMKSAEIIVELMDAFENELILKKELSSDDDKIKKALQLII